METLKKSPFCKGGFRGISEELGDSGIADCEIIVLRFVRCPLQQKQKA